MKFLYNSNSNYYYVYIRCILMFILSFVKKIHHINTSRGEIGKIKLTLMLHDSLFRKCLPFFFQIIFLSLYLQLTSHITIFVTQKYIFSFCYNYISFSMQLFFHICFFFFFTNFIFRKKIIFRNIGQN